MQYVGGFHSAFAVCDDDELRAFGVGRQEFGKAVDVGFIQCGVDLVEDAKGRRLIAEQGKEQSYNGERPLAA